MGKPGEWQKWEKWESMPQANFVEVYDGSVWPELHGYDNCRKLGDIQGASRKFGVAPGVTIKSVMLCPGSVLLKALGEADVAQVRNGVCSSQLPGLRRAAGEIVCENNGDMSVSAAGSNPDNIAMPYILPRI